MVEENILLDGVTLSGGEPFAQPEPCTDIAQKVHAAGLNVWCYTGYLFEELMASDHRKRALLEHIDVLVDGPFQLEKRTLEARFRGSSNQRILDVPQSIKMGKAVLMTFDPPLSSNPTIQGTLMYHTISRPCERAKRGRPCKS